MRKLILQMQMSVDGYVVDRDGHLETWVVWDFGDKWTWDTELKEEFNVIFRSIGCILLSWPMAGGYIRHWTEAARKFPKDQGTLSPGKSSIQRRSCSRERLGRRSGTTR